MLIALPPSLAAAGVINWALSPIVQPPPRRVADEEHGLSIPFRVDVQIADGPGPSTNPTRVGRVSRRNSSNHRNTLPDPSNFAISDDADLGSLRNDPSTIGVHS
jgi:hypothetical protein